MAAVLACAAPARAAQVPDAPTVEKLRSLPVQHDGRAMPFDTQAREAVRTVTGRASWSQLDAVGRAVVLLDAVALGAPPGTVHVLEGDTLLAACTPGGQSAHEMGAGELLRAAAKIGSLPERIALVGVEPANVATGVGLSATVEAALAGARRQAVAVIDRGLAAVS